MKKVVIIGGSGFVGTALSQALLAKGYSVIVVDILLPHKQIGQIEYIQCNCSDFIPVEIVDGAYAVINLAGAPISNRWSTEYKEVIYKSRINTTRQCVIASMKSTQRPAVLVNASAVGYYGDGGDTILTEESPVGGDFLATVCKDWELEAIRAEDYSVRCVILRTAHVLGSGGLIKELESKFKYKIGTYFGTGENYMPWVHCDDLCNQYIYAIENPTMSGVYNTAAGNPITQKSCMSAVAKFCKTWFMVSIPRFVARILLGEFSENMYMGQRVSSQKIIDAGFVFEYTEIEKALESLS